MRCAATRDGVRIADAVRLQRRSFRRRNELDGVPPLRLTVDARVIAEDRRGIGRYARAVLRRLADRDDVELTLLAGGFFAQRSRAAYACAIGSTNFTVRSRVAHDAGVVWHPANGTFFPSSRPSVATIHDAVPFRYPDDDARKGERDRTPFRRSAQTAQRIVAVSQFGAQEVQRYLGVDAARIVTIPHGVDPSFSPGDVEPPAMLQGKRYFLFVGDPIGEPRKNFALLYDAYRRAWPHGDGPLLVVAGPGAPQRPGVLYAGNLGDDLDPAAGSRLRDWYRGAIALTLASYHETFGMPMLEAMACGTPVLASRAGSLEEVGGDAALYLPCDDAGAWSNALRTVGAGEALRFQLREAGIARARRFTWEESAERHLDSLSQRRRMIRLGVDAWNLPGDRRGIGRYVREILRVWRERHGERVEVTLIVPEWHTWTVRATYRREVGGYPYRIVSRALHARAGLDVLWFPFNGCSWTSFDLPAVATLHDASNFVVPDYAPQTAAIFRAAAEKCRTLLTVSHFARSELARELHIAPERLTVIPPGVNPPRPPQRVERDVAKLAPFALYVGAPEWRKGADTLLDAMPLLAQTHPSLTLALTTTLSSTTTLSPNVRLAQLGYVDDPTLAALYRGCALLAFPSRYEGFGLPVLEAMSYGAPVVCTSAASLPEVAGDAAAYVPPNDAPALAAAMRRVLDDLAYANDLRRRGPPRAANFTWEATAERTLAAIESTA